MSDIEIIGGFITVIPKSLFNSPDIKSTIRTGNKTLSFNDIMNNPTIDSDHPLFGGKEKNINKTIINE